MIWFDLDNSPHVPLFRPFFRELDKRNMEYMITARNFAQTTELLDYWGIEYRSIGKHGGKNKIKKVLNVLNRGIQLRNYCRGKKINMALSHGSRSQLIASKLLGITSILMLDYEYTENRIFNYLSTYILMPSYIPDERLKSAGFNLSKVRRYNGFKEELYLGDFVPDPELRRKINVPKEKIFVVIRPPGMTGNYHDKKSEKLLLEVLRYLSSFDNTYTLYINRTDIERKYILSKLRHNENIHFLQKPVDGLQLLYSADITISGGGTMNRESALLGTRTYSIFSGKRPYLDEYLQRLGKLNFVESERDIEKIPLERQTGKKELHFNQGLINDVLEIIMDTANLH